MDASAPRMRQVTRVAEQQAVFVYEFTDRGYVAAAVHDCELRPGHLKDAVQNVPVAQVGAAMDDLGEVVGDEYGRITVPRVVGVTGQVLSLIHI